MSTPAPAIAPVPLPAIATAADLAAAIRHLDERFGAQAGFALALAELEGEAARGWPELLARARARFAEGLASGELPRIARALAEAEAMLAPIAAVAKTHTIHCVGHAHIDMNWMWGWAETVATTCDTFSTMLALMDEFPDFTFTQSQASVYDIARRYRPELLARIRQRVAEGRWEVAASHWVEGDRNLAGGEALCRHLLYTRRFMREQLGLEPADVQVDWSPDTFGHAATIPTIDAAGGVRWMYSCRTGRTDRQPVFWWRAPDGARVLVHREINWYNSWVGPEHAAHALAFRKATGLRDWMLVYGVGDHGGGPTRRDLRRIADMDQWPVFPRLRCARARDFFALLEREGARWPTIDGELNFEFTGCYTSQSAIKRANRVGETICADAEHAAALAWRAAGHAYQGERLRSAWCDVLFNHFHDILPGSGVAATRHYALGQLQRVQAEVGQVRDLALRALAARVDTSFAGGPALASAWSEQESRSTGAGAGRAGNEFTGRMAGDATIYSPVGDGPRAYVVVNPCAWERDEIAVLTVWDGDGRDPRPLRERAFTAVLPDGTRIAPQRLGHDHYWGHDFVELALPLRLPAGGWTAVALREEAPPAAASSARVLFDQDGGHGQRSNQPAGILALENEHLRAEFDRATGALRSLMLREPGVELAAPGGGCARLEAQRERPVGMSAWTLGDPDGEPLPLAVEKIEPAAQGPHLASVSVRLRHGGSRFTATWSLDAGARRLDLRVKGRWLEHGDEQVGIPRLELAIPTALAEARGRYEVPFGGVARPADGREVPALRWAAVEGRLADGTVAGLALLNDGKHGHRLSGGTLRLSLVRSSYDPDPLPEIGLHQFAVALRPYLGAPGDAEFARWAADFNQAPAAVVRAPAAAPLPAIAKGIHLDHGEALVTGIKRAEDGDALVVRIAAPGERAIACRLMVPNVVYGRVVAAELVDVLEAPLGQQLPCGEAIPLSLPPRSLTSVRLRFA